MGVRGATLASCERGTLERRGGGVAQAALGEEEQGATRWWLEPAALGELPTVGEATPSE